MGKMSEDFVIHGPRLLEPTPRVSIGKLIYDRLREGAGQEDAVAYIDAVTGNKLSYNDFLHWTCRLARSLRKYGCNTDDVICVCCESNFHYFIPVVAALYLGVPVAPLCYTYSEGELLHALNITKPKMIFCSERTLPVFLKLKKTLAFIKEVVLLRLETSGDVSDLQEFTRAHCDEGFRVEDFEPVDVDPVNTTAVILCSSGTTGLPKGVMISHDNVIMCFQHFNDPIPYMVSNDVVLNVLPLFHAAGFYICLAALIKKFKVVIIPRFEDRLFLSCLEKFKIPQVLLVPPLITFLAENPLVLNYDLSNLVELISVATPLPKPLQIKLKARLPNIKRVRQAYGLTECTYVIVLTPPGEESTGSLGKLMPGMSCLVRDPQTGNALGPNQLGELCFKGRMVMRGYFRNSQATENTFTSDGWLLSGDLGFYDGEEHLHVVGRLKEIIKYKGFQVPPAELEALLVAHPKIKDAGVVGVPDGTDGELALAFIVKEMNEDAALTEEEVKRFVAGRISKVKQLYGGVRFVEEIPRTASGKISRNELKKLLGNTKSKTSLGI